MAQDKECRKTVSRLIEYLKETYHYKPVPITMELGDVRAIYRRFLPEWCKVEGDPEARLYTRYGTLILTGYERIVIGDYGAFIEAAPNQTIAKNIQVKRGQEFRVTDPQYAGCKYVWMTPVDGSGIKIYLQKRTVEYADYRPGMLYISPYELKPGK